MPVSPLLQFRVHHSVDSNRKVTLYGMDSKKMEVAEIFFLSVMKPWVRWPPSGRSRPMMRPWGSTMAVYMAKFAGDPEEKKNQCALELMFHMLHHLLQQQSNDTETNPPEYGWTFTPHFSGSRPYTLRARSWHKRSSSSTCSVPP